MILSIIIMIFCYDFIMNTFGDRLKELRTDKGWTQKELASKIGCAQSSVFYWEQNKQEHSISAIIKLSEIFHVSADYLLGLTD